MSNIYNKICAWRDLVIQAVQKNYHNICFFNYNKILTDEIPVTMLNINLKGGFTLYLFK